MHSFSANQTGVIFFFLILLKSKATACLRKKCNQQKQVLKRKKKLFTPILSDEKVDTADHERVQHQTFCVLHTRKVWCLFKNCSQNG